jgi:type IV secretory pathway VirB10-like protein
MTTVVGQPLDSAAARTVVLSGGAKESSQPSMLGPVHGQVSSVTRYRRPLLGALGALGVVFVLILAVGLLRGPGRRPAARPAKPETSTPMPPPPASPAPPSPATAPETRPAPPTAAEEPASESKAPSKRPAAKHAVKKGKKAKHQLVKHKPSRKGSGAGVSSGSASVSVVD